MLSKKHYKAIAEIISDAKKGYKDDPSSAEEMIAYIEDRLMIYFYEDNRAFSPSKFTEACK